MTRPEPPRAHECGFTLAEVAISLVVFTILMVSTVQTLRGLSASQTAVENRTRTRMLAEKVVHAIKTDAEFTARMFQEDTDGRAVLAKMAVPKRVLAGSRLPGSTALGHFAVDPPDAIETGNMLFLARSIRHTVVDLSELGDESEAWRVDMFRFVVYFLSETKEGDLDLNRWASTSVARVPDITRITDETRQSRAVRGLREAGVSYAWDPTDTNTTALYHLRENGTMTLLESTDLVPAAPDQVDLDVLSRRHVAVARNGARSPLSVPTFARPTSSFPHGLELKVDGDGSGGLLMIRLAVIARDRVGRSIGVVAVRQIGFREE